MYHKAATSVRYSSSSSPPDLLPPQEYQWKVSRLFTSLLGRGGQDPLHLVFCTDSASIGGLGALLLSELTRYVLLLLVLLVLLL